VGGHRGFENSGADREAESSVADPLRSGQSLWKMLVRSGDSAYVWVFHVAAVRHLRLSGLVGEQAVEAADHLVDVCAASDLFSLPLPDEDVSEAT